jgi:hypothetical protein
MAAIRSGSRFMSPTVFRERRVANRPVVNEAERQLLADEVRRALLALHSHVTGSRSPRGRRLHQDVQQLKNKAPLTLATMLTDAFNDRAPLADITQIGNIIAGFFTAKRRGHVRKLRDLSPLETREEGELNVVQVAIDQGDHSAPTLQHFITDIDVNIALLEEMKQAATEELYGPKEAQ